MDFLDFHHHKKECAGIYNLNLSEETPSGLFSAGIHPKDIGDDFRQAFQWVKEASQLPNCMAIGECGLDALLPVPEELQNKVFREHILWANEVRKPVIIHCVRKFPELIKFKKSSETPMIVHGFNRKKTLAEGLLSAGFHLSFGSALLHSLSLQEIFGEMPRDRFFLETDAAATDIAEIYKKASEILNISPEDVLSQVMENLEMIKR